MKCKQFHFIATAIFCFSNMAFAEVPSGIIAFYDGRDCPKGWSEMTGASGRVLIGAGEYKSAADADGSNAKTIYEAKDKGGNLDYVLNKQQMPKHQHGTAWGERRRFGNKYGARGNNNKLGSASSDYDNNEYLSEKVGGGQAFDNRMPYIAYKVCKKD